jgi:hypothetical protein
VRFAGRAKIDEDSVNFFIKVVLQSLCDRGDCTLIIPWHPSQAGSERATMDGWSVAWQNAPRARLALKAADGDTYELSVVKRNHGPKGEPLSLRYHEGTLLPADAVPDDGKKAAFRRACVATALKAAGQQMPFTTQRRIPPWALKEIEAASGMPATNTPIHDELEAAVSDGVLRYVKGTNTMKAGFYPPDEEKAIALARRQATKGGADA